MITFVFMVIGVLLIVLQTTVLLDFPANFGRPDIIYLLVAFAAYRFAWLPGMLLTFVVGWIFDVLIGVNLGIYPLECMLVFFCLKIVAINSPIRSTAYEIPLVGISYFLLQMLIFFFSSLTIPENLPEWSWSRIIQDTFLLVLAAIPSFLLFNCLYQYLEDRVKRSKPARRQSVKQK
jgi:rod shape-determining protein MreD